MREIYLIRHGHPDFPLGTHMCLGRTDTPLGPLGRMQACLLGERLRGGQLDAAFSSPLARCRETAAFLRIEPVIVDALAEQNMGVWDGLSFDAIREGWPELYAQRASDPLLAPPEAETLEEVRQRVVPAVEHCLESSAGSIAVIAHASVIQALLAHVRGVPLAESRPLRPPYTGCVRLVYDAGLQAEAQKPLPDIPMTPALAEKLLEAAKPGGRVRAHCRAVAAEALRIADALPLALDKELLHCAALLHDVARSEKSHARLGAAWVRELGYPGVAALIGRHHDRSGEGVDEAAILYLADKCVEEDRAVPLEERFAESEKRCVTEEARSAHAARLSAARALKAQVNGLCGRSVVE